MTIIEPRQNWNIEQLYDLEEDIAGWRHLPNGNRLRLGEGISLGRRVAFGDGVQLGKSCRIFNAALFGNHVRLGKKVKVGNGAIIGDNTYLGNCVRIGDGAKIGSHVTISDNVSLGYGVQIPDGATSSQLNLDAIAAYKAAGDSHVFVKWVREDRKFLNFNGDLVYEFPKAALIDADGEVSDQIYGPGLHVLRIGVRPEYLGKQNPYHGRIPLLVRVKSDDILCAGMPGNDGMLRVRTLEVLT